MPARVRFPAVEPPDPNGNRLRTAGDPQTAQQPVDDPWLALAALYVGWDLRTRERFLQDLSPLDLRALEYALARLGYGWRARPDTWAEHMTNGRIRTSRLRRFLAEKFRQAATGESPRQIWTLPARYGKSLMASIHGPAWLLDLDPTANLILSSYGDDLADENARLVRDLLRSNPDDVQVRISKDRDRADRWVTTAGGGLLSAGIGSQIAGFGAGGGLLWVGGGVVLDDPFKNWQEAHSPARRDLVWNSYLSVLRLRLNIEAAFMLVVTTRWHEDDIGGRLEAAGLAGDGDRFEIVRLPALADAPDDPLGRQIGEPLDPDRFPLADVRSRQRALGSYLTASMEQQRPAPEEGGEFRRGWWQWYDQPPAAPDDTCTSWDMKLKDRTTGDFVVGQAWARTGPDFWMLDQMRGQWGLATTVNAIALMQVRHPQIRAHVIENTGNGPEVMEALRAATPNYEVSDEIAGELAMTPAERDAVNALRRRGMAGLIPENPKGSKAVRARASTPTVESGHVHLPRRAEHGFGLAFVNEAATFPNGSNDDQVDAWSQAWRRLSKGGATVSSPSRRSLPPQAAGRPAG